nr:reverse transcriptase domain-containing protein [Tanacetum cinerariifolium]
MEEDFKPVVQHQRRVNPKIHDVIKQEVIKLLEARLIYSISDSPWVTPVHCVPKKGGFTVVENEDNELIPTRLVMGWRVCIDYCKLNEATRNDHFPLPFMDQMLERLVGNQYYCFLDGFSGYFQIPIDPKDQEKTTFTCPYGTFAYRRMPFGQCNAPGMFQRCMMAIFYDMIEKTMEVFMDDFSVFGNSFQKMKDKLFAHQETISILSQHKEAQIKLYKTREDKELDKIIALENKVKVLVNIVNKTGQSVQTMNMLNNKCRTSFAKPEFLKKAQRANPRLYDIGCYNDNLALMLAAESDEVIRLEKESRSKLSNLIRPFDYNKLNNLYDLFVLQLSGQRYFLERSRLTYNC